MRMFRGLAAALAIASLAPQSGEAQQGRSFKDAWFWGLKGGGATFSTVMETNQVAPMAGVDWVITRTRGGLYVSYDQAFFSRTTAVLDSDPFTGELQLRPVELKNLRRVNIMALGFPLKSERVRPYFGLGMALNHLGSAQAQGEYQTPEQFVAVDEQVNDQKTSFSPAAMLGVQYQIAGVHLFGQVQATSAHRNFFLNSGTGGFSGSFEMGVRYNIGRSIER